MDLDDDVGPEKAGYARAIFDHVDRVTGVHNVYAAVASSALYRGAYDPALPGRIRWEKTPELTGPPWMLSAAVANGDLFVAVATDGPVPRWELVYEWPATGDTSLGKNLHGLTAIPDPEGDPVRCQGEEFSLRGGMDPSLVASPRSDLSRPTAAVLVSALSNSVIPPDSGFQDTGVLGKVRTPAAAASRFRPRS